MTNKKISVLFRLSENEKAMLEEKYVSPDKNKKQIQELQKTIQAQQSQLQYVIKQMLEIQKQMQKMQNTIQGLQLRIPRPAAYTVKKRSQRIYLIGCNRSYR